MHNEVLNALLALLEDRPVDARSFLKETGDAGQKLYSRCARAVKRAQRESRRQILTGILSQTASLEPPPEVNGAGFYHGVAGVEEIIQSEIEDIDHADAADLP